MLRPIQLGRDSKEIHRFLALSQMRQRRHGRRALPCLGIMDGRMAPRPDLIDTDVVYNRECDFISYGEPYPNAPEDSTYLYAPVETDEQNDQVHVKYVGQTQTPSKRLREHILRPGSIDRVRWMGDCCKRISIRRWLSSMPAALSVANELEKSAIYAFQACETRWDDELDGFPPLDDALLNIDIW